MRNDQYDNEIPDDLVTLPDYGFIGDEGVKVVSEADWYEANGVLMASFAVIGDYSEDEPIDSGIDLNDPNLEILYVNTNLHRGNEIDGFYHA